ncbi:MAG: glycosyl transferase, partial [Faecousia sp.]
ETEMTIHTVDKNMLYQNVVIQYRDRQEGSVSKLNTYSDGIKVIFTIFRLFKNYRPFEFFSIVAVGLAALAVGFFIPVFITFLRTGLVQKIPTLVVCGFTAIAALISFFSGVVLDTIKQKNYQDFEINLHHASDRYKDLMAKYGAEDPT